MTGTVQSSIKANCCLLDQKKMRINLDQKKYRNDQNVEHYRF